MRNYWMPFLAVALVAQPVAAQDHAMHGDKAVAGVRALYETVRGFVTRAAEQMPEADYSFKPTPDVRSYGQLVGHIANASYMFCAIALGEQAPQKGNAENLATKAEIVSALKEALAYCDRAYAIGEMTAMESANVFGAEHTRLYALEFNMAHDFEHYGNMVTYLRLKGMVPPSSMGG